MMTPAKDIAFKGITILLLLSSIAAAAQVSELTAAGRAVEGAWKIGGLSGVLSLALVCWIGFSYWLVSQLLRVAERAARNHSESNAAINKLADVLRTRAFMLHERNYTPDPFSGITKDNAQTPT